MVRAVAVWALACGVALLGPPPTQASDWLDRALEDSETFLRGAGDAAGEASDTVGQWMDDAGAWFERQRRGGEELTAEQVRQFVADIDTVNAYAIEAGYRLEGFDITLGLVPGVHLHYALDRSLPTQDLADLVERIEADDLSILQRYVLSSLLTASEYADQLRVGAYALRGVRITLAVPPSVRLAFVPEG